MRLGTVADIQQLQHAAVTQFLGQGAAEAFQGALGAGGERIAEAFRGATEDHQVGAMVEIFQQRLKEFAQLLERIGVLQATGVEHHRLELGPVAGDPRRGAQRFGAVAVDGVGEFVGERQHLGRQRAATEQQGALDGTQAPGLPAFQASRRRQANGGDQALAEAGVGEVDITVRHGTLSEGWGSKG